MKSSIRKAYKLKRKEMHKYLQEHTLTRIEKEKSLSSNLLTLMNKIISKHFNSRSEILISLFYPVGSEIDCLRIYDNIKDSIQIKNRVLLPKTPDDSRRHLDFYEFKGELVKGRFGVYEPDSKVLQSELPDIVVTPLISFDSKLNRIGYGKGFYDNTFFYLRNKKDFIAPIGIAYEFMHYEGDCFEEDQYNYTLDYLVTEAKIRTNVLL